MPVRLGVPERIRRRALSGITRSVIISGLRKRQGAHFRNEEDRYTIAR